MDSATSPPPDQTTTTHPLGVGEPLPVVDLPEPEEVFGVPHLGRKEVVRFVLGPSLIALGISIGSGEWLLGPLNVGTLGFVGVGWIITVSALLQVFYNLEFSRYVLATGEVPIVGFGRIPPGAWLWIPFSLIVLFFAFIWGGWAKAAAQGLYALLYGEVPTAADTTTVTLLAILLLLVVMGITMVSRKITRGLELANLTSIAIQLLFLLAIDLFIVPFSVWWDGLRGLVTPALPPEGSDATLLGGLAGFTALASGLNWYVMNHYRDKGYGMGSRVGYLSGLRGERQEVRSVGLTFPDDEKNAALWKRWMGFLRLDMWVVFFGGAMIGMYLPIILMRQMVLLTGDEPTQANVPTFVANALGQEYGRWLFYIALFIGFLILFDTQLHDRADRRHRPVPAVLPAGDPGADLGQHVELRRPHLPVRADLPELQAAQDGQAPALGEPGPGAQLPVLRVLLRQLRVRPAHRGGAHPVLTVTAGRRCSCRRTRWWRCHPA
jgi:hypothetical protein